MLKRLLFAACFFGGLFLGAANVHAQCVPNTTYLPAGLFPNPVLPNAVKDEPYTKNLTAAFRRDTSVTLDTTVQGFHINGTFNITYTYFKIDSVGDLPPGMDIPFNTCDMPNCEYNVDSNNINSYYACMDIKGIPTQQGNYFPFIRVLQDGVFVMPDLGFPFPIPGVPLPGEIVKLSEIEQQLPAGGSFFQRVRRRTLKTRLVVDLVQSVSEKTSFAGLTLYPNPTRSSFTIKSATPPASVTLFDGMGRAIKTQTFEGQTTASVSLEELVSGVYSVKITDANGRSVVKMITKE